MNLCTICNGSIAGRQICASVPVQAIGDHGGGRRSWWIAAVGRTAGNGGMAGVEGCQGRPQCPPEPVLVTVPAVYFASRRNWRRCDIASGKKQAIDEIEGAAGRRASCRGARRLGTGSKGVLASPFVIPRLPLVSGETLINFVARVEKL